MPADFSLETKTEIAVLEKPSEEWNQWEEGEPDDNQEPLDDMVMEAQYVAKRIEELVKSNQYVSKPLSILRSVLCGNLYGIINSTVQFLRNLFQYIHR